MRQRAVRAVLFSALGFAFLAGTLNTSSPVVKQASSAQAEPLANVALARTSDPYATTGFRWNNRPRVEVYSNWDGGACSLDGTSYGGSTGTASADVSAQLLQASIDDINASLAGGLVLVNAGPVSHAELCTKSTSRPIVIGWGTLPETGRTLSYGMTTTTGLSRYSMQYARAFITNAYNFACSSGPTYRDLQHTITHELLHAIGVGHSADASALMTPVSAACQSDFTLQPDDIDAINFLYPPTTSVVALSTPAATVAPSTDSGIQAFATTPMFSTSGQALAVFDGRTVASLEAATSAAGASGVWVQDSLGGFQLLVVDGPTFVKDAFNARFPGGFTTTIAVTLVR